MSTAVTLPSNELTEFDLPRVCVVTGATEGVEFYDVKFQWFPRWIIMFVGCALIIYLILAAVMTKRVRGKLPFTPEAFAAWRRNVKLRALGILGFVVLMVGALVGLAHSVAIGAALGAGAVACLIATIVIGIRDKAVGVICTKIADGQITLKLPSAEAAREIQDHLHAGAPVAQAVGA